jgi:DNA-binding FadR family transcriptional regulator
MTLGELKSQVEAQTSVIASATTLIQGLHQKLTEAINANDPAAIQTIADELAANTTALSAAVTTNTPSATEPATPITPPSTPTP